MEYCSESLFDEIQEKFTSEKRENLYGSDLGMTIQLPQNEDSTNLIKFLNLKQIKYKCIKQYVRI